MLTPIQIKENFKSLIEDVNDNYDENVVMTMSARADYGRYLYHATETESLTEFQWDNLVKVCSIIKANFNRFAMNEWHGENHCGTTHCIAGWAVSLAASNTNLNLRDYTINLYRKLVPESVMKSYHDRGKTVGVDDAAAYYVSDYIRPFFYIINADDLSGDAESLVMKYLVNPVLEEAERESYELSEEFKQFMHQITDRSVCPV